MSKKEKNIVYGIGIFAILFVLTISSEKEQPEVPNSQSTIVKNDSLPPMPATHLDSVIEAYSRYFKVAFDSADVPGAAICIVADSQIVYQKTYGVKKVHTVDFVDKNTVFRLASVSKGFAAMLTGLMVQEGIIDWDDKIITYLPELQFKDTATTKNLTIRHLLSHTSGLVPHAYDNFIEDNVPYEQILQSLKLVDICCPPGEVYGYQNVVYSLIADILEVKTGKSYDELLSEYLFDPLGMETASANFEGMYERENFAVPHSYSGRSWYPIQPKKNYYAVSPAAGVNASIEDMSKYLMALTQHAPEIVDTSTLNQLFKPYVYSPLRWTYTRYWNGITGRYYGLGWRLYKHDNHWIAYHGGYVRGYRAEIAVDPEKKIGIALLMNGASSLASQSVPYFFNTYYREKNPISAWDKLLFSDATEELDSISDY